MVPALDKDWQLDIPFILNLYRTSATVQQLHLWRVLHQRGQEAGARGRWWAARWPQFCRGCWQQLLRSSASVLPLNGPWDHCHTRPQETACWKPCINRPSSQQCSSYFFFFFFPSTRVKIMNNFPGHHMYTVCYCTHWFNFSLHDLLHHILIKPKQSSKLNVV